MRWNDQNTVTGLCDFLPNNSSCVHRVKNQVINTSDKCACGLCKVSLEADIFIISEVNVISFYACRAALLPSELSRQENTTTDQMKETHLKENVCFVSKILFDSTLMSRDTFLKLAISSASLQVLLSACQQFPHDFFIHISLKYSFSFQLICTFAS